MSDIELASKPVILKEAEKEKEQVKVQIVNFKKLFAQFISIFAANDRSDSAILASFSPSVE